MTASKKIAQGLRTFAAGIAQGFLEITHNSFALVGLTVIFIVITLTARPELREVGELKLFSWLQTRQIGVSAPPDEVEATERSNASDPKELPKQQADLAFWLSKKYHIAPEPLSTLVAEAYDIGLDTKLDPTLILAVMAIESGFNPFAQSAVGAQGLMQVMTQVHRAKFESFGGKLTTFDPLVNLRVGVKVLQDCIRLAGSIEGGLKNYVGAANIDSDGGYTARVMAEYARLQRVAQGRSVPIFAPVTVSATSAPSEKVATLALK
jgi:soluble lytic murein transglycosylase-like protein